MGVVKVRKPVIYLFLACGMALVTSNTLLAYRVARLQRLDDFFNRSNKLQVGEHVPPLMGYDLAGKKVAYGYTAGDNRKTFLIVLSPTCHACDENWPNWTRIAHELNARDTRLLIANISAGSSLTSDYLAKHEVGNSPILSEVIPESMEAYKLAYTPQTILIASDGKILKVRTGMLKGDDLLSGNWTGLPASSRNRTFRGSLADISSRKRSEMGEPLFD